jgi:microcystin-dependent protein
VPRYGRGVERMYSKDPATAHMGADALAQTGGSQPHNNLPPYLTFTFCIAMQGVFPQRP